MLHAGVVVGTYCRILAGTQFTCFTGTKVQILTLRKLQNVSEDCRTADKLIDGVNRCTQFTCFPSTKVQIPTPEELCLLKHVGCDAPEALSAPYALSLLALLVQKYKY